MGTSVTSKGFITAETVVAVCGLAAIVLRLLDWDGTASDVAALIFGAVMVVCGGVAAGVGLKQRRQEQRRQSSIKPEST